MSFYNSTNTDAHFESWYNNKFGRTPCDLDESNPSFYNDIRRERDSLLREAFKFAWRQGWNRCADRVLDPYPD